MSKLEEAKVILNALQVPTKQQNSMCCCVLLAMAIVFENTPWQQATNGWIRIHDVIAFADENYDIKYAENSRETIRKQCITLDMQPLLRIMAKQQTAQTTVTG